MQLPIQMSEHVSSVRVKFKTRDVGLPSLLLLSHVQKPLPLQCFLNGLLVYTTQQHQIQGSNNLLERQSQWHSIPELTGKDTQLHSSSK